ncbi:hypothetical protein L3Q82_008249 [Scortum barcoo]|uniref:Uncharacterized protein n=1 Tax=Scortum barcoo TaxID=214431 RepID=A0ACB8WHX8_9TELE|nr:hypothetical protein L3Q82_008249 [Scortum barcoo]
MEPITSWSEERVSEWLQGLDATLHQYPLTEWRLSGLDLLQLTSQDLEKFGVHKIGHQELILEAVEKLCSLTYGLGGENLRSLTEKLRAVAHTLQMGIQSLLAQHQLRWTQHHQAACRRSAGCGGAHHLCQRTILFAQQCRQLVAVCDEILNSSPEALLTHTAQLESVDLVPVSPGDQLGIEITSTGSSNHYVTGTAAEPSADVFVKILAGDEVIQVNDQIVVGWSRANLVKKLRENPNRVTLVLKKIPGSVRHKDVVQLSSTQKVEEEKDDRSEEEEEKDEEVNQRHSIFERVADSVRSLSFRRAIHGPELQQRPMGQEESDLPSDKEQEGGLTLTSYQSQLSPLSATGDFESLESSRLSPGLRQDRSPSPRRPRLGFRSFRSSSPQGANQETASISSCPEMVGHMGNKDREKSSTKGTTTAMSRRRVSCRELGRPDCDGWLWKKRKDSGVFIAQKWQRFWFVLKGPSLYWYTSQQDEKAEGFVNIASYNIESAGEHKRK